MAAEGYEPSTAGVADAYPFADALVLDTDDGTALDRPVVRTDIGLDGASDAERVAGAVRGALGGADGGPAAGSGSSPGWRSRV